MSKSEVVKYLLIMFGIQATATIVLCATNYSNGLAKQDFAIPLVNGLVTAFTFGMKFITQKDGVE